MACFLSAGWRDVLMVSYEIAENSLLPYLPAHVELDLFQNKAYVSLVAFQFADSKIFNVPIPYYGTFIEVNLRFYVKRKVNGSWRRGVVFISEIVPHKTVAVIANHFYKEHYAAATLSASREIAAGRKSLCYNWRVGGRDYCIEAGFDEQEVAMEPRSLEEFIYEHYYGYTKVSDRETWEYRVDHPRWKINRLQDYSLQCDFQHMYGEHFASLNPMRPAAVFNAAGSAVSVDWKINKLRGDYLTADRTKHANGRVKYQV